MYLLHRIIQLRALTVTGYICGTVVKFVIHAVLLFCPVSKRRKRLDAETHICVHLPVHFAFIGGFKVHRIARQFTHAHSLSHGVEFAVEFLCYLI